MTWCLLVAATFQIQWTCLHRDVSFAQWRMNSFMANRHGDLVQDGHAFEHA